MYLSVRKEDNSIYTERRICVPKRNTVSSRRKGEKKAILTQHWREERIKKGIITIKVAPSHLTFSSLSSILGRYDTRRV